MHDPDAPDDRDGQVGELFSRLRGTEPERGSSQRMWRRIEAELPRRRTLGGRIFAALTGRAMTPAWRFASVAAAALLVGAVGAGVVLWTAPAPPGESLAEAGGVDTRPAPEAPPGGADEPQAAGDLVLLSPPSLMAADAGPGVTDSDDAATSAPGDEAPRGPDVDVVAGDWELEVRLVRGYDGPPPADAVVDATAGAGGASPLRDLRSTLQALLPFGDYALVGRWSGAVASDGAEARTELSDAYRLGFRARPDAAGQRLRLEGVRLLGAGEPRLAGPMTLLPGQLYLLGVRSAEDAPSLVLAVRARRASGAGDAGPPQR